MNNLSLSFHLLKFCHFFMKHNLYPVRLYNTGFDLIQKACYVLVTRDIHFISSYILILLSGSNRFILRICVRKYQHLTLPFSEHTPSVFVI